MHGGAIIQAIGWVRADPRWHAPEGTILKKTCGAPEVV
jgi:hypothetical protein